MSEVFAEGPRRVTPVDLFEVEQAPSTTVLGAAESALTSVSRVISAGFEASRFDSVHVELSSGSREVSLRAVAAVDEDLIQKIDFYWTQARFEAAAIGSDLSGEPLKGLPHAKQRIELVSPKLANLVVSLHLASTEFQTIPSRFYTGFPEQIAVDLFAEVSQRLSTRILSEQYDQMRVSYNKICRIIPPRPGFPTRKRMQDPNHFNIEQVYLRTQSWARTAEYVRHWSEQGEISVVDLGDLEDVLDADADRLRALGSIVARASEVELARKALDDVVSEARALELPWTAIGSALGITPQAANRRWDADAREKHRAYARDSRAITPSTLGGND